MRSLFNALVADEQGITAIEYGILATLVALASVTAATNLGTAISGRLKAVTDQLNNGYVAPKS